MQSLLAQVVDGTPLSEDQSREAFEQVMSGQAEPMHTAALLAMIEMRGPSVEELTGAARVMRDKVDPVEVPYGMRVLDTCGTGGDHARTFNISTAAALVTAAAARPEGVGVAKHGNKSVTSGSGSSQVLEQLGVSLRVHGTTLTRCLDEAGICFCFAPTHHPAMRHAAPVRKALGFRTLFNLVGPLTNPAGAQRQVMGVFRRDLCRQLGQVLRQLGADRAMIVHGLIPQGDGHQLGGLDELSTCGTSQITELRHGELQDHQLDARDLGISISHPSALRVEGPEQSAAIIQKVLDGHHGPARDIVVLNAAAALVVAEVAGDFDEALARAAEAVDSQAAQRTLDTLVRLTGEDGSAGPA